MKKLSFVSRLTLAASLVAAVGTVGAGSMTRSQAQAASPVAITYYDGGQTLTPDYQRVLQAVEDKFYKDRGIKVALNMVTSSYATSAQKINTLIAAGQLDAFTVSSEVPSQAGFLTQPGLLQPVDSLLKTDGPHVSKILAPALLNRAKINGQTLGLYTSSAANAWVVFWIRQDLLTKAGLPLPHTLADLEKDLLAFKGMGVRYPMSSTLFAWLTFPFAGYEAPQPYLLPGGKLPPSVGTDYSFTFFPQSDRTKMALTLLHRWYAEGLFNPPAVTGSGDAQLASEEATGKVAAAADGSWLHANFDQLNAQKGYKWTMVDLYDDRGLPSWPGYGKGTPYEAPDRFIGFTKASSAKVMMDYLDWLASDPANERLVAWGIQGRDYKLVDGKEQALNGSNGKPLYGGELGDIFSEPFAPSRFAAQTTDTHGGQVWLNALSPKTWPTTESPENVVSYNFNTQLQTRVTDLTTYADAELQKLILGEESVSNLPQIYARFQSLGLAQIMAEKQRQYDAAKK